MGEVFPLRRLVSSVTDGMLTVRAVNGHSDHKYRGQARQQSDQPGMEERGLDPTAIIAVWIGWSAGMTNWQGPSSSPVAVGERATRRATKDSESRWQWEDSQSSSVHLSNTSPVIETAYPEQG